MAKTKKPKITSIGEEEVKTGADSLCRGARAQERGTGRNASAAAAVFEPMPDFLICLTRKNNSDSHEKSVMTDRPPTFGQGKYDHPEHMRPTHGGRGNGSTGNTRPYKTNPYSPTDRLQAEHEQGSLQRPTGLRHTLAKAKAHIYHIKCGMCADACRQALHACRHKENSEGLLKT